MYSDIKILEKRDDGNCVEQVETFNTFQDKCISFSSWFKTGRKEEKNSETTVNFREESGFLQVEVSKNTGKRLMSYSFEIRKTDLKYLKEFLNGIEE